MFHYHQLCLLAVFVTLAFTGLNAQQDNTVPNTRDEEGIVRQDPFVPIASKLSQSLQSRIQLDDDQTNKVRDILMSYYATVRDVQGIQRAAARDMTGTEHKDKSKTGKTGTPGTGTTSETDRTGTSGTSGTGSGNYGGSGSGSSTTGSGTGTTGDNETQRAGGRSDMDNSEIMQSLRDNDIETNQDIEDVLNDAQKSSWLNVKTSWWQEVKQEVYNFNPASDVNPNMDSDKNKSKKRGSGTGTGTESGTETGSGTGTGSDTERR